MSDTARQFTVPELTNPERIDRYLAGLDDLRASRSQIQKALKAGLVTVNGVVVAARHKVSGGEIVNLRLPQPEPSSIEPEEIPLEIVYEDEYLLVVNKPAGMVTHPAAGARSGTLVHALLAHTAGLSELYGRERAGIVHRLDKNTTGLLVVAKDSQTHRALQTQLEKREIRRTYLALVCGHLKEDAGVIDKPIGRSLKDRKKMAVTRVGSREAQTVYRLRERFRSYDLVDVELKTGRTHQIRVHFAHLGHPVFGDPEYGGRDKWHRGLFGPERLFGRELLATFPRQALHARALAFTHPHTGQALAFDAALPPDFQALLDAVRARR
ncbi:MAG TPA: RluA family pseudouridine synthase [candidate division Zixibacteria bacterium]|nr:RluA family pseudouridine synthase [candidate division Zixibacteria bacterium]